MRCEIISKSKLDKRFDETDIKIIELMVLNKSNKEISSDLQILFLQYREELEI